MGSLFVLVSKSYHIYLRRPKKGPNMCPWATSTILYPFPLVMQPSERIPCRGCLLSPLALFCSVPCPWTMPETLWLVTMKGCLLLTWKHPSVPYYHQDRKGRLGTVPKCPRDLSANTVISNSLCRSSFQRAQMGVCRHWPKGQSSGRHHTVVLNFSVASIHMCIHTYVPCFHQRFFLPLWATMHTQWLSAYILENCLGLQPWICHLPYGCRWIS